MDFGKRMTRESFLALLFGLGLSLGPPSNVLHAAKLERNVARVGGKEGVGTRSQTRKAAHTFILRFRQVKHPVLVRRLISY